LLLLFVEPLGLEPDAAPWLLLLRAGFNLIAPLAPPMVSGITIALVSMRLSALRAISWKA